MKSKQLVNIKANPMVYGEFAWKNGKIVPLKEVVVSFLAPAINYGLNGFEGLRFYQTLDGRAIFRLRDHINRFIHTADVLRVNLEWSRDELEKATMQIVKRNHLQEGYIRPNVYYDRGITPNPGPDDASVGIGVCAMGKYFDKPLRLKISPVRRLDPSTGDMTAKIGGYYVNSFLANAVRGPKCDEALLLDTKGYIAEGPGANVFFVNRKSEILTPALGSILPGITRDTVMTIAHDLGLKVIEKRITPKEAKGCRECFMTGTAAGVASVIELDGTKFDSGKPGAVTQIIGGVYHDTVHAMEPKYERWLTFVDGMAASSNNWRSVKLASRRKRAK